MRGKEKDPYAKHYKNVHGDVPPNPSSMPGEIRISSTPINPSRLQEVAEGFKKNSPGVIENAQKEGKDVFLHTSSRGTTVIVGAGIALALAALGAYEIYIHKESIHRKIRKLRQNAGKRS